MPATHFLATRLFSTLACLMGAAGVITAAGAGHGAGQVGSDPRLLAAAQMLLVHAVASLVLSVAAKRTRLAALATAIMQAGAILFAADMTMRAFAARTLFPMAAPIGGSALILGWLVAAAFFARAPRTGQPDGERA